MVATVVAMPPQVGARVVASMSPELSEVFGIATFLGCRPTGHGHADVILVRLDSGDARAIVSGLPASQQRALAVVEAEESGSLGGLGWLSPCS